jgi:hypothetical protein
MHKLKLGTMAAIGVLALGTIGGVTMRANAATPASPQPAAATATVATDKAEAAEPAESLADTDAVQEEVGDQNAPDNGTEAGETESTGAEEPGDENLPGGGHADPDGQNVDHQFEGVE